MANVGQLGRGCAREIVPALRNRLGIEVDAEKVLAQQRLAHALAAQRGNIIEQIQSRHEKRAVAAGWIEHTDAANGLPDGSENRPLIGLRQQVGEESANV